MAVALSVGAAFAQEVSPPVVVSQPRSVWPEGEAPRDGVFVLVLVDVDSDGRVTNVVVERAPSERFGAAALAAARALRFEPARRGDEAIAAQVRLRVDFTAPADVAPTPAAQLKGVVVDSTTRRPIARARVEVIGRARSVLASADGRFSLETEAGPVELRITADGYRTIGATETLVGGEALEVRYALAPTSREAYETLVVAPEREEVGRRTLQHVEVRQTPGTMGDPFRVIETLPGVVPIITGVPYYYVRGAPPADTGYFLDGVRVPALFHLALGPSVVHPNVVDRIDFYAGGAPARYPGFVGGIVGATTAPIPRDRLHLDVDVRLIDAGGIVSVPFDEGRTRVSASGRYSYTAALLSLASPEAIVDYWDYQLRFERDLSPDRSVSLFGFGSFDLIGERDDGSVTTNFAQTFHRVVGNHRWRLEDGTLDTGGFVGADIILIGEGFYVREYTGGPRMAYTRPAGRDVDVTVGVDATYSFSEVYIPDAEEGGDEELRDLLTDQHLVEGGMFVEADFRASRDLTLLPSVRTMGIYGRGHLYPAVDPRFGFRRQLGSGFVLKGSAGWYHQRPAFVIPLPGLDSIDLARGLQRSIQVSQGLEWDPGFGLTVDAQVFFHRYDNLSDIDVEADGFPRLGGNAYGLELIVRRSLTEKLFGWVAYTLSRSERRYGARCDFGYGDPGKTEEEDTCEADDPGYVPAQIAPSDFDRTHVANLVLSYELPRHFRLGGRLQYRSGRPYTPLVSEDDYSGIRALGPRNSARIPGYVQLDLRIDKRWTYDAWNLELYFEFINVTFSKEPIDVSQSCDEDGCHADFDGDDTPPIVIPTLGVRGVF